jgi:hypothetical protein
VMGERVEFKKVGSDRSGEGSLSPQSFSVATTPKLPSGGSRNRSNERVCVVLICSVTDPCHPQTILLELGRSRCCLPGSVNSTAAPALR